MKSSELRRVASVLVPFASLQLLTQLGTAIAGLLVVRILSVAEFAVYAIAVSVQGTLTVLSDIGVSTLLLSRAGSFAGDQRRLAQLLNAARSLRARLFVVVVAVAAPLLWWSLSATKPTFRSWSVTTVLVLTSVGVQVSATLDGTMALALLRSARYQASLLVGALVRLGGVALFLARAPFSWVGLVVNILAASSQAISMRLVINQLLPREDGQLTEDQAEFRRIIRTQVVNAAYYAFSSQITLWLVGWLSTARTVAEIGALGRISSILVLAQSGVTALVAPRIARLTDSRLLLRRYLQVVTFASLGCCAVIALSFLYPSALLWFIGPKYEGLGPWLPIAMAATLAYALSVTLYSLNASRAWIEQAWLSIPLTLLLQGTSLLWLDVSQLNGALVFGFCSSIPSLMVQVGIGFQRLRRELRAPSIRSASV